MKKRVTKKKRTKVDCFIEEKLIDVRLFPSSVAAYQRDIQISSIDNPVTLGVRFASQLPGTIDGLLFYAGQNAAPTLIALYKADGLELARIPVHQWVSGWNTLWLDEGLRIDPDDTYVAAALWKNGQYPVKRGWFGVRHDEEYPLYTEIDAGVYSYSEQITFPTQAFNSTNYFVDVVFKPEYPVPQEWLDYLERNKDGPVDAE